MSSETPQDIKLPKFREDLKVFDGPLDVDGSPTFNIYDPIKGVFYKISWREFLVFKSFNEELNTEELAAKISHNFPVKVTAEDVKRFFAEALSLGLLKLPLGSQILYDTHNLTKETWYNWFVRSLFFLRFPLFRPDSFLERTLPYFKFLGSRKAFFIYSVIILSGLVLLLNRLDQFFNTFYYFFNFQTFLLLACTFTCVKCIHELSHAYTAKNFGLYIPTIGIGLLFFWPVLYTDVTHGWKLRSKKSRFLISSAGIAAELVIAGLATIGWIFSSPGVLQSLFFIVATTTWFSSIVINSNPLVRFDGYYILSDLWGIDNLSIRTFKYTRWWFHYFFFGIEEDCPEENISKKRAAGFIIYAILVIAYRIFIYTVIALVIYHMLTKIIGILFLIFELWIFFILPIFWETKEIYRLRSNMKFNFRTVATSIVFLSFAIWFFIPWPHTISFAGLIAPQVKQVIYAPESGKIKKIEVVKGQEVKVGAPLIQMSSEALELEISEAEHGNEVLKNELLAHFSNFEAEDLISQKKAELAQNEQLILGLEKRSDQLNIIAEENGIIVNWDSNLNPGQYVSKGQIFGIVADETKVEVIAFVNERDINFLEIGQKAEVLFLSSYLNIINTEIISIDRKRVHELIYPSLASNYGGPLAVIPQKKSSDTVSLILHDSYYQITLALEENSKARLHLGQSVEIKTQGPWRSYFMELLRYIYQVVFRESSF